MQVITLALVAIAAGAIGSFLGYRSGVSISSGRKDEGEGDE